MSEGGIVTWPKGGLAVPNHPCLYLMLFCLMQDTYLPVCRFLRYIIDLLVYLYHVCMLISVSISVSIHNVSSIAFSEGKGKHCCQLVFTLLLCSDQL